MSNLEESINQLICDIKIKGNELMEIESKISFKNENELGEERKSSQIEIKELQLKRDRIYQQKQRINDIEKIYQKEIEEMENIKKGVEDLIIKKDQKELDLLILREKHENENKQHIETQELLESGKKILMKKD